MSITRDEGSIYLSGIFAASSTPFEIITYKSYHLYHTFRPYRLFILRHRPITATYYATMYVSMMRISVVAFFITTSTAFVLPSFSSLSSSPESVERSTDTNSRFSPKVNEQHFLACLGDAYSADDISRCATASIKEVQEPEKEPELQVVPEDLSTLCHSVTQTSLSARCARKARALGWSRYGSEMASCMAMD